MKSANRLCLLIALPLAAWGQAPFEQRLRAIKDRPQYAHSRFGVAIYPAGEGKALYRLNANEFFVPGSTTKLVTEGVLAKLVGPDFRFRTPIYRTGPLTDGVVHGDLVVVASGDPNLSGRIRQDGSLAFLDVDHSYSSLPGAAALPGDPIAVVRQMAKQVAARGIRKVTGRLLIDASLFPEGERELGSGVYLSPICVNDNLIDATLTPAVHEGDLAAIHVSPETGYARVVNKIRTISAKGHLEMRIASDVRQPDGSRVITVEGSIPHGAKPIFYTYKVPEPARFAAFIFREALAEAGVKVEKADFAVPDARILAAYQTENLVAEHISLPLIEDVKLTLKVSQNMHASAAPYLIGALVGGKHEDAAAEGFRMERRFFEREGLDASGASQSDGACCAAHFTPDFMCAYLNYMRKQSFYQQFHDGLPVLGRDGTLHDIQTGSPAAGKVFAKTGTYAVPDNLQGRLMLTGKGLAGYMTTRDRHEVVFAFYVNFVPVDGSDGTHAVGEMLGEIATAAWESAWTDEPAVPAISPGGKAPGARR